MGFFDKLKKITSNLFSSFSEADELSISIGRKPSRSITSQCTVVAI